MKLSLNGEWKCMLPDGCEKIVNVPGCWDTYTEEKDIADKVVFRKTFYIEKQESMCYRICFGAVSYYCNVFLNGKKIGSHEGMWDHFAMTVDEELQNGENELYLEIWKPGYKENDRFPLREVLSGFIPDVLYTFGGIWDDVWIETAKECFVDKHWASGDKDGNVKFVIKLNGNKAERVHISGKILNPQKECVQVIHQIVDFEDIIEIDSVVNEPELWRMDRPSLYSYVLQLKVGEEEILLEKTFGFREVTSQHTKILLNEQPIYVRGILHWGYYEDAIPLPNNETIRTEIERTKRFGFNMIKHCLYIPRESYLKMADEMGMLLWIELPLWLPEKTPELNKRIRREFPRLMEQIAGHPSVIMLSLGCELDDKVDDEVLKDMYWMAKDKLNVLVRDNSGSGECYGGLAVDYADFSDYHFYGELQNMENLMETFTPVWKEKRPWVYGEFCDSDTLRDMKVLREAKNIERFSWELQDEVKNPISILKPDFFLGKHDACMEKSGIRAEFEKLKELSYNHSMVHRKTTLEQTRSFQTIGGYNITSIRDVPIATSGMFDDFMQSKFDENIFRKSNQDVMLIPAWDLTRIWLSSDRVMSKERYGFFGGEMYGLHLLISNYGGEDIEEPKIYYELKRIDGTVVTEGTVDGDKILNGTVGETCYLNFRLPETASSVTCILKVKLESNMTEVENEWPVFLYPCPEKRSEHVALFDPLHVFDTVESLFENIEKTDGRNGLEKYQIVFCSMLTYEILEYAKNGGSVFYVQRGEGSLPIHKVAFWREGMIRKFEHPMLSELKYESWMDDLRYFGSATDTAFADVEDSRFSYRTPIIRRYDCREWRADDYLMELGLGKGRILATTLRLEGGMGKQPLFLENNRFARWLLDCAVSYLLR